jgi:choline dehydrogenase
MTKNTPADAQADAVNAGTIDAETFDYVVVGAGAAGSALAARLSESGAHRVLLLEAGPADTKLEIKIPAAFSALFRSKLDWNYDTEPQPQLNDRRIFWPRGRVLGGSSSMNAMMWIRGFPGDYDGWAEAAGPGWSWRSLLPYFLRVENVAGVPGRIADAETGTGGAISIRTQRSPRSHTATFLAAARELGLSVIRANSGETEGVSETMVTQSNGSRFSAADGYLKPARKRANLIVRTGAHTTRVLFEGTRAVGVAYLEVGIERVVSARREVVLCGGTVNTPQLLMLSGIGDRDELQRFNIDVVAHSPEVGKNLRDHLVSAVIVEARGDTLYTAKKLRQLVSYLARKRGMLTSNVAEGYGFIKTDATLELPDIELIFAPVAFVGQGLVDPPAHGLTVGAILLQPKSTGTVSLASANPRDKPLIDPRYLSDAEGADRATLMAGLAFCERLIATSALAAVTTGRFVAPEGAESMPVADRDALSVNEYSHTLYHPVGTARMGLDAASVVDEELRVRGVQGLRVADASVMPAIIRGHTNAPSLVIGEKAAALLLASNP